MRERKIMKSVSGDYEPLKNTWIMCILAGMEDLSSRLTKKMSKFSRKCFSLCYKKKSALGLEDNDFDNDINPWKRQELTYHLHLREALWTTFTAVLDTAILSCEHDLGHSCGAIRPDIRNSWVATMAQREVHGQAGCLLYRWCSREKFSGWMVREGYKDVWSAFRRYARD